MNVLTRLGAFARRHKKSEEVAAEAVGLDLVWFLIRLLGVFGAGAASAAVFTTSTATYHPQYSLSVKGAAFLARNEGLRTTPYNDPYNCTVGVGHLIHMGVCSSADYRRWRITTAQALTILMHDSGSAQSCVNRSVTHPIDQAQSDALVDFTFNVGCGGLQSSSVLRELNAGRPQNVPSRLLVWSYASGHYLAGLHSRRVAEGVLFTRGYYGDGIGYLVPKPKPVKPVKPVTPKPLPAWSWKWAAWRLGHGRYKGHPSDPKRRPASVPKAIPSWAWHWYAATFKA